MSIWALSDPHLSFGAPEKSMEAFGPEWKDYAERIETHWRACVCPDDLVLVPGDISWAMRLEDALVDLRWIDSLPGTKLLVRGNHDYWWGSASKLAKALPPSIRFIQNNAFHFKGATIGGSRLWDSAEYAFGSFIHFQENPREREPEPSVDGEKIFVRELERLKLSLNQLDPQARLRIAITHYPPIGADLKPSRASDLLERYNVQICVFGHLHSLKKDRPLFGEIRGVRYILASCDYLDFRPIKIADRGATDASPWL